MLAELELPVPIQEGVPFLRRLGWRRG